MYTYFFFLDERTTFFRVEKWLIFMCAHTKNTLIISHHVKYFLRKERKGITELVAIACPEKKKEKRSKKVVFPSFFCLVQFFFDKNANQKIFFEREKRKFFLEKVTEWKEKREDEKYIRGTYTRTYTTTDQESSHTLISLYCRYSFFSASPFFLPRAFSFSLVSCVSKDEKGKKSTQKNKANQSGHNLISKGRKCIKREKTNIRAEPERFEPLAFSSYFFARRRSTAIIIIIERERAKTFWIN